MKKLTRLKLINWHRFSDVTIDFGDSTLISGENGAGKSTLLDAIQFVVTCSTNHFNKAAHENGKRKLTGYIRCKTGRENHPYERTGEISAHVALEFYEESKEKYFVIGAVIDSATEGQETVVRYLMDNVMLEDEMFKIGNRPRTITEFRSVRSSSKLEDSHYQPFAGIYSTYMIPMTSNEDQTLRLLGKAIKSVYASVYFASSRAYIQATANLLSEEKMAVVIQEGCGTAASGYFFPTISGVARSLNFYPIGDEKPQDGIVNLAFGLGKLVVDGGQTLRFSPRYPKNVLQLSTPELALSETQREMYALNLKPEEFKTSIDDAVNLQRFEINKAKHFRNMRHVASTWDMQNQRITDSTFEDGRKIVTFSRILKYDTIPLAQIVCDLLEMGEKEMRCPIEMEFAVDMDVPYGTDCVFNFLQIRPIVDTQSNVSLDWSEVSPDGALVYAEHALGLGAIGDVCDVVYIRNEAFDSARTQQIADEIGALNNRMRAEKRSYVLIGPGRWGSSDPWLGIPVKWTAIFSLLKHIVVGISSLD